MQSFSVGEKVRHRSTGDMTFQIIRIFNLRCDITDGLIIYSNVPLTSLISLKPKVKQKIKLSDLI